MSRRHVSTAPTVSLFPFLAVLLCTMGALLVLLVLFSRAAEDGKIAQTAVADRSRAEELELARDEFAWRLEQLATIREETAADLSRVRMQLAGIEDDSRALEDEFKRLDETIAALEADASAEEDPDASLDDLEKRLATARDALEATRRDGASRPPAYAVVPYEGRQGTRRRPLYIECCIDGVFLQPEGIRLGPGDFEGPPGPGNPLASALRAAREHIAMHGDGGSDPDVQPYPLLLVRPSGVMAYYAAREAIQSWGNEFGYQFVDEDWQLEYPPADPALAAAEARAVEESRRRLEWLAQVRPPQPTRPTQQYRAATTRGGIVAEGGPTVLGDRSRFDWKEQQAARGRGAAAGDPSESASALGSGGGPGGNGIGSGAAGGGTGAAPGGSSLAGGAAGAGDGGGLGGGAGDRYAGPSRFYSGQPGGAAGSGTGGGPGSGAEGETGTATFGSSAGADAGTGPGSGDSASGASNSTAGGSSTASGGTSGSTQAAAGGSGGTGGTPGSAGSAGNATGGGGSGPSMPGLAGAGSQASQDGGASGASASISLAGRRGSNWASLATQDRPVPLTRPIKLECAANEFRLLGDDGRVEERVPIGTRTVDAVDPLVQAVHAKVGRWGIAGDRMYWRPQLVLTATPDGVERRDELERLLADSGLDTRRSEMAEPVRPLPPVRKSRGLFSARSP